MMRRPEVMAYETFRTLVHVYGSPSAAVERLRALGVDSATLERMCAVPAALDRVRKYGRTRDTARRNAAALVALEGGASFAAVGEAAAVTRDRVRQIWHAR